jgi:hypothetical protein
MAIMWAMEPTTHEVIDVITVGHAFVSAARPMRVRALDVGRATQGIGVADLDKMFVDMIPMHVMQMTIVEVIHMAVMAHGRVSAARTMLVSVIKMMLLVGEGHGLLLNLWEAWPTGRGVLTRLRDCLGHAGR